MSARDEVLGRIRQAVGERPGSRHADYDGIPHPYVRVGQRNTTDCIDLFLDRIRHYNGGVYRCSEAGIADAIRAAVIARAARRLVVPVDLPRAWLPAEVEWVDDSALGYPDLDRMDGVLTGCSVAIATTGTLVLRHGPAEGRRALTLIPDYHLCVVFADQIVETVPEGLDRAMASRPALLTTISGPSATSDIEMTRIKGVHGPRTLDVLIVDTAPAAMLSEDL